MLKGFTALFFIGMLTAGVLIVVSVFYTTRDFEFHWLFMGVNAVSIFVQWGCALFGTVITLGMPYASHKVPNVSTKPSMYTISTNRLNAHNET